MQPLGTYVPLKRHDKLLLTSGLLPLADGELLATGAVTDATVDAAYPAAQQCAKNALALIEKELGSLDAIKQVVSVTGYVQAASSFAKHPQVINGASDYLVEILGERGQHVRTAVGVASLPLNASVEISFVVEFR